MLSLIHICTVDLIGVHDCREDILLTTHDLNGCFVGIFIELLGELVATVMLTALPSERRCGLLWMVPLPMVVVPTRRAPVSYTHLLINLYTFLSFRLHLATVLHTDLK